ncbi:hypothetical protein CH063_08784 [Colletotrichum higginsianum]|uniref:Uncharacterized protein n=1 Tax=Colletotrichum higginsianum (strain IMI 349063) TaxID=759273 RepID=H1VB61_COLHI|nr:hypothetical protein CH063_08784 [Colletotrichum higginsianum]
MSGRGPLRTDGPRGCDCATRTASCSSLDVGEGGFPPPKIYAHKRPPGPLHSYPHRRYASFLSLSPIGLLFSRHAAHLTDTRHQSVLHLQRMPTFLRDEAMPCTSGATRVWL